MAVSDQVFIVDYALLFENQLLWTIAPVQDMKAQQS